MCWILRWPRGGGASSTWAGRWAKPQWVGVKRRCGRGRRCVLAAWAPAGQRARGPVPLTRTDIRAPGAGYAVRGQHGSAPRLGGFLQGLLSAVGHERCGRSASVAGDWLGRGRGRADVLRSVVSARPRFTACSAQPARSAVAAYRQPPASTVTAANGKSSGHRAGGRGPCAGRERRNGPAAGCSTGRIRCTAPGHATSLRVTALR
jgi:hypothetical protein